MTNATINEAVNSLLKYNGQRIAMPNGQYFGECTAVAAWYMHALGLPIPPMHNARADGWGVAPPAELRPYFTTESYHPGKAYPFGTIMMWDSPHIAVVLHSDGSNTVNVFQQNADPNGASCEVIIRVVDNAFHHANYVMIPIVDAPVAAPQPYTSNTDGFPKKMQLKTATHKWDLNYRSFAEVSAHPIPNPDDNNNLIWGAGTVFDAQAVYHSTAPDLQQYTYYSPDIRNSGAFNALDCVDYVPPVPYKAPDGGLPVPLATTIELVTSVPYYASAYNAVVKKDELGKLGATKYFVFGTDRDMLNLTTTNGKDLQHWVNPKDNVKLPVVLDIPVNKEPDPILPKSVVPEIHTEADTSWRLDYRPYPAKETFLALHNIVVKDIDGIRPDLLLKKYDPKLSQTDGKVFVYGTFLGPDSVKYYRLKDPRDVDFTAYYGVPILDKDGLPVLVKQPVIQAAAPVLKPMKKVSNKDRLHLVTSHMDEGVIKFIDIIPSWYKKIKKG